MQFDECSDGSGSGSGSQCWPPNPSCDFTVNCGTWEVPSAVWPDDNGSCCQSFDTYYGCTYVWADCSTTTNSSLQSSHEDCWPYFDPEYPYVPNC
jgi:hypothetical protein